MSTEDEWSKLEGTAAAFDAMNRTPHTPHDEPRPEGGQFHAGTDDGAADGVPDGEPSPHLRRGQDVKLADKFGVIARVESRTIEDMRVLSDDVADLQQQVADLRRDLAELRETLGIERS